MPLENLLQPTHLIVVLAIALIVLGPKRLPETDRAIGHAIRGFKESLSEPETAAPDADEEPAEVTSKATNTRR